MVQIHSARRREIIWSDAPIVAGRFGLGRNELLMRVDIFTVKLLVASGIKAVMKQWPEWMLILKGDFLVTSSVTTNG